MQVTASTWFFRVWLSLRFHGTENGKQGHWSYERRRSSPDASFVYLCTERNCGVQSEMAYGTFYGIYLSIWGTRGIERKNGTVIIGRRCCSLRLFVSELVSTEDASPLKMTLLPVQLRRDHWIPPQSCNPVTLSVYPSYLALPLQPFLCNEGPSHAANEATLVLQSMSTSRPMNSSIHSKWHHEEASLPL